MGVELVLSLLGGLGLFLYGMQMMSTNLEAVAGNRMKQILERLTANRFLGVFVGAGITALIQSSSATTVMTVGFVNSGLMSLRQAVWIIMGANIGTTITGQLIALDVGVLAPLIAFAGIILLIFVKNKKIQHIGGIVAGIGVLFIGMGMMSDAMVPLRDSPTFVELMTKFSNPLLGIIVGAVFTAIIQSSSASVGILQALAMGGVINLHSAVFVLFGQNIGTCITALLASIGTSRNAKRATMIHFMFNVIGTVIFVTLCILTPFTDFIISLTPDNPVAQIANVHTIFNITTTVILLPFGTMLEKLATMMLPDKAVPVKDTDRWFEDLMASKHHLGISTIAINQIHEEITAMLDTAAVNVSESFKAVAEGTEGGIEAIAAREEEIDLSNMRLSKKISKILVLDQTPKDIDTLNRMYTILGNIERIGDHAMNLAEYAETIEEKKLSFSEYAKKEIAAMESSCREGMDYLHKAAMGDSEFSLSGVVEVEQRIDDITHRFRQNQIDRMREGNCSVESSILYSEMLTDYERIGDHMLNIAQAYAAIDWSGERGQTAATSMD
ncbi:MAG: Na/Pi cotransporter family protein [Clostridiaceae bacterium]|uniref:Na/Pi cotransporter family protein n=1 Tax=Clostridium porci TaxID=2605778 RepID=A0A7X2NIF3_9CLOT|nr:Na/Pi cotransporter family protein [Clostridium porci]MDY3230780.1 Na/Pi cotransporter family protein [Clostridiaceae bacterium]MSS35476.1 Na/Pi cotransporter family protein [Clostridium porci]